MMSLSLTDYITLAMFIISLSVFIIKPAPAYLKYFPIYFISGFLFGLFLEYTSSRGIYNTTETNVYSVFDFSFLYFVLREIIVNLKVKRIILFTTIAFALFAFINIFFVQKKIGFNPVNFTIACVITVSFCIYYYFELFQKTETQILAKSPSFWIVTAILFNIVLTFPMFALLSFMNNTNKLISNNIDAIYNIIIVLTYILYSIGFLCRIQIRKSYL